MLHHKICIDHKPNLISVKRKEKENKQNCLHPVKKKRYFRIVNTPFFSFFKQKKKFYGGIASSIADFYINLSKNEKKIINLIISMSVRYQFNDLVPSQGWIAKQVGCSIRTVNGVLAMLHRLGIIKKKGRGWRVCEVEKYNFKSNTCKYSMGKSLPKDMEFINAHLPRNGNHITKLLESIPALLKAFSFFCILTLNVNYKRINIDSLRSSIFRKVGYNEGVILPTSRKSTLSKELEENILNVEYISQDSCVYAYRRYNVSLLLGKDRKERKDREKERKKRQLLKERNIQLYRKPRQVNKNDVNMYNKMRAIQAGPPLTKYNNLTIEEK